MDSAVAAGIVQLINHRMAKNNIQSLMTRYQMGVTKSKIGKKRIIFGNDGYREHPFAGWWIMINQPADTKRVLLKELAKIILAHADPTGHAAEAIGGGVATVHSAHSTAGDLQTVQSMGDGSMASSIAEQWDGAWKAGVWSSVKGTSNEFAIGFDYFLTGGYCTMSEPDADGVVVGRCMMWNDKDLMTLNMSIAEREGGLEYAVNRLNTHLGWAGTVDYKYSANDHRLEFI